MAALVGTDGMAPVWVYEDATRVMLAAAAEGYAPVFAGPFGPPLREHLAGVKLTLSRGRSGALLLVNEAGEPLAGAKLQVWYPGPPMIDGCRSTPDAFRTTDATGRAFLQHLGAAPLNVRAVADGYESDELTAFKPDPAKPYRWILKKAAPLRGQVVGAATGRPVAGAKIKYAGVRGPHEETNDDPQTAPVIATTDAQGRFALTSLRPDSRYYFFVDAAGFGGVFVAGLTPGKAELRVPLGPELYVRGTVVHAPESVIHMGKVHLQYGQTFGFEKNHSYESTHNVDLEPKEGAAEFKVGPFYVSMGEEVDSLPAQPPHLRRPVGIYVESRARADFTLEQLPVRNYVMDLGPESPKTRAPAPPVKAPQDHPEPPLSPARTKKGS